MDQQPNSSSHGFNHCRKCGKSGAGENHTIYYGNSRRVSGDVFSHTYQIQVGGSRAAWICDRCKWKAVLFRPIPWLLLGTPLVAYVSLSLNYVHVPLGTFVFYTLVLYACYTIFTAQSKYLLFEFYKGAGARQVRKVYKKVLTAQGYPILWTPGEYEKMMKGNRR